MTRAAVKRTPRDKKKAEPTPVAPLPPPPAEKTAHDELVEIVGGYRHDPLGFVRAMFPWGEPGGELAEFTGPDQWQIDVLEDIGKGLRDGLLNTQDAVLIAVTSGHGIGKSALVSWITLWAMSTEADTKGVVTANTEAQLKTKTWAELAKWHRLCEVGDWFEFTATALYSKEPGHDKTWRIDQIAWSETRSEAFAGLHNKGRRVLLIFDEASAIPDIIWEVAEGALTDENTEIIFCCFGNPTRARGRFRECFGRFRHRWITRQIDSRTARMTNKKQLQAWVDDYGLDSDFVRVRVLGQFPLADANALLSPEQVDAAMVRRYQPRDIANAPMTMGVDVARQGMDDSVIAKRQGLVIHPLVVTHIPDLSLVADRVAMEEDLWCGQGGADAVNVDGTGGYGSGVIDTLRRMRRRCNEVQFAGKATDPRFFNKRSEIIFNLANFIKSGGALPNDPMLREELLATTYTFQGDKLRIVEKEDVREEIGRSPDRLDACALTFALNIGMRTSDEAKLLGIKSRMHVESASKDYNPLDRE